MDEYDHSNWNLSEDEIFAPEPTSLFFYRSRKPKETPLYQIVDRGWSSLRSFVDQTERRLPEHIRHAIETYLKCGLPQYGAHRIGCTQCPHERYVAFSCKSPFCNSCNARRMTDATTHIAMCSTRFEEFWRCVAKNPARQIYYTFCYTGNVGFCGNEPALAGAKKHHFMGLFLHLSDRFGSGRNGNWLGD